MGQATTTAVTPGILIEECVRLGIDRQALLTQAGISADSLSGTDRIFPLECMLRLWEFIGRLAPDTMFAVHTAEKVPFGVYGVMDFMLAVSSCPREALERSSRSFSLVNNAFELSFRSYHDSRILEICYSQRPRDLPRPYVEYIFTSYLTRLRFATHRHIQPSLVEVAWDEPEETGAYEAVFGAPFRFGQPANRMIFPGQYMELRHTLADAELCEILETYSRRRARESFEDEGRLRQIREVIGQGLKSGKGTLAYSARQLAMSPRSLQRELHGRGTSFHQLLTNVREQRALRLLADQGLPLAEIAAELRFSGTSSFCHAFQHWKGCSPGAYRKSLRSGQKESALDVSKTADAG